MDKRSIDDVRTWSGRRHRQRTKYTPQPELLDLADEFITRETAATIAGTAVRTVDRWLADPAVALAAHRTGRARRPVLISRDELRALLVVRGADETDETDPNDEDDEA